MADDERLTKAERREQAREERRRKEAEEAARARRRRITSIIVGLLITAFVVWVLWLAFSGRPGELETPQVIDPAAADEARGEAGCVAMPTDLSGAATHFEPAEAPPADTLYTLRPAANGPHFVRPVAPGVYRNGVEERAVLHSQEHGAITVWWNPDLVEGDTVDDIADWAEVLNANGFGNPRTGAGIFASEFEGEFTSGKPIALRGWGVALDCDEWDETIGNAFVVDHYGTHGLSPEANLGPYPEDVLLFGPGADETESPNGRPENLPAPDANEQTDGGEMDTDEGSTDEPTTDATDEGSTDEPTTDATDEPTTQPSPTES